MHFSPPFSCIFSPPFFCILSPLLTMLQPILENAFEYVVEKQQSQGVIRVSFVPDGEMLSVVVEDNGKMLTDQKLKQMQELLRCDTFETMETTGMINIHRRIRLIYGTGNSIGLTLERSTLGGLKVTLKIGGTEYVSLADR